MNSRLDRLFLLLDQGTSSITRRAAAQQLGEVQKLHPHELNNLLSKVRGYLQSSCWDTRIAASLAIEAIIKQIPEWLPDGIKSEIVGGSTVSQSPDDNVENYGGKGRMKLNFFDITKVMELGKDLLASEGSEYDVNILNGDNLKSTTLKEKLTVQRELLNKKLGLDLSQALDLGIKSDDLVSNDDLQAEIMSQPHLCQNESKRVQIKELFKSSNGTRKRKSFSNEPSEITGKRLKVEVDRKEDENSQEETKVIDLNNLSEWPLQSFCDQLMGDLFNAQWEVRHGAATALREIIKVHGKCAGRPLNAPKNIIDKLNQYWLEDLALRLICVLALDKFGDFVSDQVVAPVRETCAQALGSVFNIMSKENVFAAVSILLLLLIRPEWETRHGGLLALKYLLAIRTDLTYELLPLVFDHIFNGLKDSVDDVSAVAAAALVPVRDSLIETLPDKVPYVIDFLWDALLEIDELTSSTSDILKLLSSLLVKYQSHDPEVLRNLVPRLWPFVGHSLSTVRLSVIESFLVLVSGGLSWLDVKTLSDSLRLLYQRCLLESNSDIIDLLYKCWLRLVSKCKDSDLLSASCQHLSGWICLMMHPAKNPIDASLYSVWLIPKKRLGCDSEATSSKIKDQTSSREVDKYYLGGDESLSEIGSERNRCVIRSRLHAAKFIGLLAEYLSKLEIFQDPTPLDCFVNLLLFHLNSKSAIQRTCVAWIVKEWSEARIEQCQKIDSLPQCLVEKFLSCLNEVVYYDELLSLQNRLQQEAQDFVATLKNYGISPVNPIDFTNKNSFNYEQVTELITTAYRAALNSSKTKIKPKILETVEERRRLLSLSLEELVRSQNSLSLMVSSSLSSSLISWKVLPEKLNPIVRPIMEAIKKETNEELQKSSAQHLALLLNLCINNPKYENSSAVLKIVKNLVTFLCSDPNFTPNLSKLVNTSVVQDDAKSKTKADSTASSYFPCNYSSGIISLNNMCKQNERGSSKKQNSSNSVKKSFEPCDESSMEATPEENEKGQEIMRRGACFALKNIVGYFGEKLPVKLPQLWEFIVTIENFKVPPESLDIVKVQDLVNSLQVLEIICPHLNKDLHPYIIKILPVLCICLENYFSALRHMAARCIGVLSTIITRETMDLVLDQVLDMLASSDNDLKRQGAVEAIYCTIEKMGIAIVPYIVLLIIPMLGRMSDQHDHVRLAATHCFAQLVQLMPLDDSKSDDKLPLRSELLKRKQHERHFVEQLMNPKKLDDFRLPVPVNAELRSYQQEGVNWLSFLNRYKLHGILCDEMGLGKTLMSICILASDHFLRSEKYAKSKAPDSKPLPSLVVCPPTLTGHWVYEIEKFVDSKYLRPLNYTGPPFERAKLRNKLKNTKDSKKMHNVVIASYDIVRNDIDFFNSISWNYCILDEGHIIKNGKTKLSKAIKSLSANHRLILTGTPIQNNVLELWSLFDFLMPGFLGTERQFSTRYSKPILQSRDPKSSSKEQESGVLAMESLHRQSLPFILRRMKEDVLKDLPPKIMQDYYCELSELQSQLYEDFAKSKVRQNLKNSVYMLDDTKEAKGDVNSSHIFQALQYLRKVCNHPKLVLTPQHPQYGTILSHLKEQNSSLTDINHAAKLCALKQLLLDCGIGSQGSSLMSGAEPVVNQHRALIFCQLKGMLDIVENDLLKAHMPSVSYLRLDGSIPPGSRQSLVYRFNNDPSIDVLLLTTQVGGLGLNLTGADTVIFVEHDWNPTKDLQAMDRAHRIGQKKVVNVYRLITKGTLEEKIMGLQKFKLTIANSVISSENSGLQTMGTDQLLDLFCFNNLQGSQKRREGSHSEAKNVGVKSILESLPELWDQDQYENEYDLSSFIKSLKP